MSRLKIHGDITNILNGVVTKDLMLEVPTNAFRYALGGASFTGTERFGETILIEGVPHIFWNENGTLKNESHPKMYSPFLIGIQDVDSKAITEKVSSKTVIKDLYAKWAGKYSTGCAIIGCAHFPSANMVYIKKAPIHNEKINDHKEDYWSHPDSSENGNGFCFGILIPSEARAKFTEKFISRAFYHHPEDLDTRYDSHTHAAWMDLKTIPETVEEMYKNVKEAKVTGVRHLLTSSTIDKAIFQIIPLE